MINRGEQRLTLGVDALFLAIGAKPNTQLFQGQLDMDEQGYIVPKKDQETSVEGVFAIGDIVDPVYKQAVIAAGQGAIAACQAAQAVGPGGRTAAAPAVEPPSSHSGNSIFPLPPYSKTPPAPPSTPKKGVIDISGYEHFKKEIEASNIPIFVDFYATWCGPCRSLSPMYDAWAKEYAGKAKFLKVNVDKNGELVSRYHISSMPTMIVLDKNGKQVTRKTGTQEIANYMKKFDPVKVK